jgi:DNA-binding SARP family transcriptional activator
MRFRILGHLEVQSPDGWTAVSAPKWRSLLACLLVRPGQLVSTESLIFELWGDNPPSTANNMVSIYVHRLRKEVIGDNDGQTLVHRAPGYLLRVAPGDLDSQVFESLIAKGRSALAGGEPDRAAELLAEALGLWRGPLLADVPPSPLLAAHADRAAERWLDATELRVEADLACGRAAQVVAELRGLVAEHPLRERLWALLLRALEEAGRRAEAFEAYAQARQVISDELGVEPGSELQRLYSELLAADASAAAVSRSSSSARTTPRRPPGPPAGQDRQGGERQGGERQGGDRPSEERPSEERPSAADEAAGRAAEAATAAGPRADPPGSIAIGTIVEPGPAWAAVPPVAAAESGSP